MILNFMMGKRLIERKKRAVNIARTLKKLFPKAKIALNYRTQWELLISVILSAQCTDIMVNKVTRRLFKKYRTLHDYARANQKAFEKDIRQAGFYRNKAKHILKSAKIIKERFKGRLPRTMDELLILPGVARKTANVVLGNAFNTVEGIAVDTHVRRFAIKFDLTDYKDPKRIEKDLMDIFPKKEWFSITYRLIEYGRKICPARIHNCKNHSLTKLYPRAKDIWPRTS